MEIRLSKFHDASLPVGEDGQVTATIVPWIGPQGEGNAPIPASYGASLAVGGQVVRLIWGAGYATHPIPIIALAVARVLEITTLPATVIVRAPKDFGRYWGPNGDMVAMARRGGLTGAGKPVAAWPTMQDLQSAHIVGRWSCLPHLQNPRSRTRVLADEAMRLSGMAAARSHKKTFSPAPSEYPDAVILQGGTYDLP